MFLKSIKSENKISKSKIELFLEKVLNPQTIENTVFQHDTVSGRSSDYAVTMIFNLKNNKDEIKIEVDYHSNSQDFNKIVIDINKTLNVFHLFSYDKGFDKSIELLDNCFDIKKIANEYQKKYDDYYASNEYFVKIQQEEKERLARIKERADAISNII